MPTSGLQGPYALSQASIDAIVAETSPGAYALGRTDANNVFLISYVGRSDSDLNGRLKCHVGNYAQFKASYFPTALAAFQKECHLFHDFGETTLDNKVHPARAEGTNWKCPRCNACG